MGSTGPTTIVLPHRGWLFDLDGTVYRGERLIPGADGAIAALRAAGRRVAFLSNKPLQTRADYARKLTGLGIPTREDDVVNSSLVLARHLARLDPGAPVFVIGEPPLIAELRAHGFEVRPDPRVRWVVIAFDRTFDYAKLNTALQAVTGHTVEVIVGKPSPIILEVALARLGVAARECVIVGDRLETDMAMGKRLGLATVLVLSGVTREGDARIAETAPDLVLASIRDLVR